jgi:hypothetical protein
LGVGSKLLEPRIPGSQVLPSFAKDISSKKVLMIKFLAFLAFQMCHDKRKKTSVLVS